MKYLSHYTEEAQTKLFDDNGAFFAFSTDQFNAAKKDGVKYAACGAGLICPKENIGHLMSGLKETREAGIKLDMEENGAKAIIWRELGNHECQITMDTADAVAALDGYPITEKEINMQWGDYFNHCVENDYF